MKRKILLPLVLLAGLTLTGCKWFEKEESKYKVEITNKTELQAEWYAGAGSHRDLSIKLTPAGNPVKEMASGNLVITSSDPTVANITGLGVNALSEGDTKVTVKYHGAKDSVDLHILPEQTVPVKYGVTHYGTAEDPLTNEEALTVAKHPKYAEAKEDLYVRGEIASFYHAPGARDDGYVSWFLKAAEENGEQFEIYKCKKADGSNLTDDDVWVNGTAVAHGKFTSYDGQYETSEAVFVSCEGNKPQPRTTLEKTFAEALSETKALADGADTYDYYQFEAYVTKKSGTDYFLTATQGEAIEDTKVNTIQLYKAQAEGLDAKLTKNAKIKATMVLKNYHGQVENLFSVEASQIEVLEEGGTWDVIPEPEVTQRTLAEFIAGENTKARAYEVTAEIKAFKDGATKDQYGNMTLTDGENDLIIYGATATTSALVWNNSDAYAFTNPKDFQTNPTTSAMNIGDTVTMKLIRADFKDTIEGTGIVLSVTPAAIPDLEGVAVSPKTATANIHDGATSQQFNASPVPANAELSEVTWSVTPKGAGVEIDQTGLVTIASDATEGEYEVRATVTIDEAEEFDTATLTVVDSEDVTPEEQTYVVDFSAKTASHAAYGDTWTYGDVTVSGGANNNGDWAFVKMGGKSATISAETYPGTYVKTNNSIEFAVATVTLDILGKSYNKDSEKAVIHIESYSDAALTTKVGETSSQEVPDISTAGDRQSLSFSFATPTADLYYKVVIDITNTTTYNGVFCLEKITFSSAA